jgi:uncharacterized membrane protein
MTLPVILIMISNHYPALTGGPYAWLCVALISVAGVSIRHFFNLRHVGREAQGYLVLGAALFGLVSVIASLRPISATAKVGPPPYAKVAAIVQHHCVTCHSPNPTHPGFTAPPAGVVLDSPGQLRLHASRIYDMAVATHAMPLGNETAMTDQERETLGRWIKAGAKSR